MNNSDIPFGQWSRAVGLGSVAIVATFIFASCSPSWHLKQAERHLRKAEQSGAKVMVDTVYATKTVIVPEVRVDTLFERVNFRDTIVLNHDRFHVKVKVDTLTKSVYMEGKCDPDTIRIELPVSITKEIKSGWPKWWLLVAALAGAGLVAIFRRR